MVSGPEKALLAILLIVLMIGMGATLDTQKIRGVLARPKGLVIGVASQFGWMPLLAFGLAWGLGLPDELALGLLIVGCTPGGTTSNLFAYLAKADLALSIAMTAFSTALAVVAMPAVLWVYGRAFTDSAFVLPLRDIAVTLTLVLLPVAVGMAVRSRSVVWARRVERAGGLCGVAVLVVLVGSAVLKNQAVFQQIPAVGYVAAVGLGVLGMGLGYGAARLAGLPASQVHAVSLETGVQNSALAIGIILATFPDSMQDRLLWMPLLYALCVLISASVMALLFRATAREPQ